MYSSHLSITIVLLALSCWNHVLARSSPPRPLRRLAHPSTLALEILPRRQTSSHDRRSVSLDSKNLHHTDSFRLTLDAFGETFHLHLRPNEHLIHPAARINYYSSSPSGQSVLTHTEPLLPESVKAYWGEVIPSHLSAARMREDAVGLRHRPKGPELGWARITVHHQGDVDAGMAPVFEGAFSVNGVVHHIVTKDNYMRTKHSLDPENVTSLGDSDSSLVIWRDSDVMKPHEVAAAIAGESSTSDPTPQTCGLERFAHNTDPSVNPHLRKRDASSGWWYDRLGMLDISSIGSLTKRDDVAGGSMSTNFLNRIGNTAGCPVTQKVLYMGVAADCEYTAKFGSQQNATTRILTNWNTATTLYKQSFNVSLGIVELSVFDPNCPAQNAPDPNVLWNVDCTRLELGQRLSVFSDWRGRKGNDGAGLWHLMSGCPSGAEVGIAWLGTLCEQRASGSSPSVVSGTAVSTAGRAEWQVIAHETGHNFGAIHDCSSGCSTNSPCCPLAADVCDAKAQFLMSPTAEAGETVFSQCSLGNVCALMAGIDGATTNTTCLSDPDPNRVTISLQMCGNGIVEAGEDCDPGKGVSSACCDPATCKFRGGAVCDPASSPCCTDQCSFAPSTRVCRPAKDTQCDKAEFCTGNSSSCPADDVSSNGQSCGPDGLACASGQCTSIGRQCQNIGASMGLSKACPQVNDRSCQVSCQDPLQPRQCVLLQSQLIDGSPCGFGGTCIRGNCQSGNLVSTAKAWFTSNLQISIPVTVVAGIVLLLLGVVLFRALRRCCRRKHRTRTLPATGFGRLDSQDFSARGIPPVPGAHFTETRSAYRPASIPQALQPGYNVGYTRVPPDIQTGDRASVLWGNNGDNRANSTQPRVSNGGFPTQTSRNSRSRLSRDHWVDDTIYNGPR